MKKIFTILFVLAVTLTMAACGPNSKYFNVKTKNFYYYKDQPLVVNPYDVMLDTLADNDDLKQLKNSVRRDMIEYYYVEVEYRKAGETQYKSMSTEKVDDFAYLKDDMIYSDNPGKILGNNQQFDFKIHFIDRETKSEKTMLNLIGTFSFIKSPANAFQQQVSVTAGDTYNVLDNVEQYNASGNLVDLSEFYTIKSSVMLGEEEITVSDDFEATFTKAGTYDVTVVLTQLPSGEEADTTSSASESGASDDAMVLTIVYKIKVE